jgi:hypothetical protein
LYLIVIHRSTSQLAILTGELSTHLTTLITSRSCHLLHYTLVYPLAFTVAASSPPFASDVATASETNVAESRTHFNFSSCISQQSILTHTVHGEVSHAVVLTSYQPLLTIAFVPIPLCKGSSELNHLHALPLSLFVKTRLTVPLQVVGGEGMLVPGPTRYLQRYVVCTAEGWEEPCTCACCVQNGFSRDA